MMIASTGGFTTTQKEEVVEKKYDPTVMVSYLAAASASAEAGLRRLPRVGGVLAWVADVDAYAKLEDFWEMMRHTSLLGKALWELRVRHIMPPTPGV